MYQPNIIYGAIVAGAAVASAASAREDRRPALIVTAGLAASWLIFVTSWAPWSAAMMLSAYVVDTDSVDIWAMCNCLNGLLVLYVARHLWWGALMFGLLLNGCFADVLWWANLISWGAFKQAIDLIFKGEMAVLYSLGGWNAAAILVRRYALRRDLRRSVRAASKPSSVNHG